MRRTVGFRFRRRGGRCFGCGSRFGALGLLGDSPGLLARTLGDPSGQILGEPQFLDQRLGADLFDVHDVDHAHGDYLIDHGGVHAFDLSQGLFERIQSGVELIGREDVDIPPGQAGAEANVLTALADRQRKLIFDDDDRGATEFEAQGDFGDLGGLERVGDENLRRVIPPDDVDLLSAQLIDDALDAAASNPHAGADGVYLGVQAVDGNLGAIPGLPGQGLDLDDVLGHFGHFKVKQRPDEVRMRAGENDLDLPRSFPHVQHHRADSFLGGVGFSRNLLALGQEGLGASQFDHQGAAFPPCGPPRDDLAFSLEILFVDAPALRLTNALNDHLLGRLRGDAAQIAHGHLLAVHDGGDVRRVRVDVYLHVFALGVGLSDSRKNRRFQVFEHRAPVDVLVASQRVDNSQQFLIHSRLFRGPGAPHTRATGSPSHSTKKSGSLRPLRRPHAPIGAMLTAPLPVRPARSFRPIRGQPTRRDAVDPCGRVRSCPGPRRGRSCRGPMPKHRHVL